MGVPADNLIAVSAGLAGFRTLRFILADATRLSRPAPKRGAAARAGESRRPFGRPPPHASCVRVFASGGGR